MRGASGVAAICGVDRQTIYDWINERRVERLIDARRLTCVSGVPIENLACAMWKSWPLQLRRHVPETTGRNSHPILGSMIQTAIARRKNADNRNGPPG